VVPVADNLVNFEISGGGRIIGVGNGDPSSHEPDVYLNYGKDRQISLNDWRMLAVSGPEARPEIAEAFPDTDWEHVDVNSESGSLSENTSAVFRTHLGLSPKDLDADKILLRFGTVDDDGWIYVNGQAVGESHDWQATPNFDVRKFVHVGDNSIAVVVHNADGPGGIDKGVSVSFPSKAVHVNWKRRVFNGLAQVIIQSGTELSEIRVTSHAEGLASNTVVIEAKGHLRRPQAVP
jgi:beta-galactosidase